jgi:HSP20 family protein
MKTSLIPLMGRFPRPLGAFPREMEELMERFFAPEGVMVEADFTPSVNLAETDASYEVTVDLPGLRPEDVKVEVRDGSLLVSGERQEEKEEKGKTWHRVERRSGSFWRSIPFATAIDPDKVDAEFKDGVLRVRLPKSEEVRPKRIEVKA